MSDGLCLENIDNKGEKEVKDPWGIKEDGYKREMNDLQRVGGKLGDIEC